MGRLTHMGFPGSFNLGPAATVDFYLYSSHEVAVWESIVRALRSRGVDAMFVLEPPGIHRARGTVPDPAAGWHDDKTDGELQPLVDTVTHESLEALLDERGFDWLDRSRPHADAVVTTQGTGWLDHYTGARIKTEYGVCAFEGPFGHGTINQGLDAVLAHGHFSARSIAAHLPADRIHVVGYPKWAEAKRYGVTRSTARAALDIETDLPLVAWLPTWAHNSSIDGYADDLAALANDHLIVAKPHHNNLRFESARLAAIDTRIEQRGDLHTLVELMIAADVVVADARSGALAESILADRPVVGLLPGVSARQHGVPDDLDDVVTWCERPDKLADAVRSAIAGDRRAERARWRPWFFAEMHGVDDDAAAEAICQVIQDRHGPRSTAMSLVDLHALIDEAASAAPVEAAGHAMEAWRRWPGHPQLLALIHSVALKLDRVTLELVARTVRASGHVASCPAMHVLRHEQTPPDRRIVAGAVAATAFDEEVSGPLARLCAELDIGRFDSVLAALAPIPHAIGFFVNAAASTPDRCRSLASTLTDLGAEELAAQLTAHAESLIPQ